MFPLEYFMFCFLFTLEMTCCPVVVCVDLFRTIKCSSVVPLRLKCSSVVPPGYLINSTQHGPCDGVSCLPVRQLCTLPTDIVLKIASASLSL